MSEQLQPDEEEIRSALLAIAPQGPWQINTHDPENPQAGVLARHFDRDNLHNAVGYAASRNRLGENVYFLMNQTASVLHKKASKADIARVLFIGVDCDLEGKPETWEDQREEILPGLKDIGCHLIIDSGGGYQGLLRIKYPIADIETAERLSKALIAKVKGDKACWNVDRIMRLPGTVNWPNEKKRARGRVPVMASLVHNGPGSLTIEEIEELLDENQPRQEQLVHKATETARIGLSLPPKLDELSRRHYEDRSEGMFAFCCEAVRQGIPDSQIVQLMQGLGPGHCFNQHLETGSSKRTAQEQLEKAIGDAHRRVLAESNNPGPQNVAPPGSENGEPQPEPEPKPDLGWLRAMFHSPIDPVWLDEKPPDRKYLFRHGLKDGKPVPVELADGFVPMGKACMVSAAGGAGKTQVGVQAAISAVTGRKWLRQFHVAPEIVQSSKRVLLLLGEEDPLEARRRLYRGCYGMSQEEKRAVLDRVVPMPLAGHLLPMLKMNGTGIETTPEYAALLELMAGDEWCLVVIDPQARFAGVDVEGNNLLATTFVQIIETFTRAPGGPCVLVCAHSSKQSRREGGADSRGVTGLTDAFRWHCTLSVKKTGVELAMVKNNLGPPMPERVVLLRDSHGGFYAETPDEAARRVQANEEVDSEAREIELEKNLARMVEVIRKKGPFTSKRLIARQAGLRNALVNDLVDLALQRGLILKTGTTTRNQRFVFPPGTPRP